jgi:hypothetical protein
MTILLLRQELESRLKGFRYAAYELRRTENDTNVCIDTADGEYVLQFIDPVPEADLPGLELLLSRYGEKQ